ncbi:MAG: hypothetical protein CME62_11470 [Halobacteriovoraceae bacterium]|nr:hypothetical protein [Halobacteriovoraceae bacterium]|tara:strand:+ start:11221 stop:12000 length:780 start_codon:yes stop_codon:yes gene_type:complete
MKKLINLLLFFSFISCGSYSLSDDNNERRLLLKQYDPDDVSARDLNLLPEVYLEDNSALQDDVTSEGFVGRSYYTGSDDVRVSASINYSQDYEDPTKVQMIDLQYLSRFDESYREYWWGLQLKRVVAKFNAIADEPASDSLAENRSTNNQSFTIFGFGLGHRFRALASEFFTDRFFENINVFGNYMFHIDGTNSEKYQGWGYTAEYGLNYRSSKKLFYGGKLSYNWALVDREARDEEKLPERSLVFGWFTLGFEIGFYF